MGVSPNIYHIYRDMLKLKAEVVEVRDGSDGKKTVILRLDEVVVYYYLFPQGEEQSNHIKWEVRFKERYDG